MTTVPLVLKSYINPGCGASFLTSHHSPFLSFVLAQQKAFKDTSQYVVGELGGAGERAEADRHAGLACGEASALSHGHRYAAQLHCKQFWQIERSQTLMEFGKCESLKPGCWGGSGDMKRGGEDAGRLSGPP